MKRTVVRSCSAVGRLRPQSGQERHRGLATLVSRTSLPDNAASHRHTAPQHLHGRLTPLLRTTRRSYATPSSSAHDADRIIDGRKLADQILDEIRTEARQSPLKRPPHLVMVCMAPNHAIKSYMRMKQQACQAVGFTSSVVDLDAETSQDALSATIHQHTTDASVDGIIVQLPLPEHINPQTAIGAIGAAKDVDGLHPTNVGASVLGIKGGFLPCTPAGVLQALQRSQISLEGQHVVVVGRSKLVGLPLANMLIGGRDTKCGRKGPTVTVVHSGTVDIHAHTRRADIVIVAAGHAGLITADSVKQGVVLVDVGINHVPDSSRKSGYRLVGDCTDEAYGKASRYTPVPGGIGPMTVALLMKNTWDAAKRNEGLLARPLPLV